MKSLLRPVLRISAGVLLGMLLIYAFLYFSQDGMIFIPQTITKDELAGIKKQYPDAGEITVKTPDGITLHGWFLGAKEKGASPLLIYFGGNAEEASGFMTLTERFKGWSLLLMNYRGYGLSQGRPSEKALFEDAVLIYDLAAKRKDVDPEKIVAMGRSLGSGVAVYLASERPLKGVILVSPYDSIRSVARDIYPFAPVSLMLRHPFDSLSRAPSITAPMLAVAARDDKVIPLEHSVRLAEKWGGRHHLVIINGVDHNSIIFENAYHEAVDAFLNACLQPSK
ncbi:MAG: alpha/beta fold hydrolase [Thermodesulfovibrionales bacterium]|nr:alpha/beta fold hydrolase [Thermodesulfovibrionales bacterium]